MDFIVEFKTAHNGNSPTVRGIMEGAGIGSTSVVAYYLRKLECEGRVKIGGRGSRYLEVVGSSWSLNDIPEGGSESKGLLPGTSGTDR